MTPGKYYLRIAWAIAAAIIAAAYSAHIFGPLRLNGDSMEYLSLAASAIDGDGFLDRGEPSHFPSGYPALIALLYNIGANIPMAAVGVNLAYLAAGVVLTVSLARDVFGFSSRLSICLSSMVPLSWVIIKHAVLPMPETMYLGTSLAALYAVYRFERSSGTRRWAWLCVSILIVIGAIMLRTLGVALIPVLVLAIARVLWHHYTEKSSANEKALILGGASVLVGAPTMYMLLQSIYFQHFVQRVFGYGDTLGVLSRNLRWKLLELGQITLNVPTSLVPDGALGFVILFGLISVVAVVVGLVRRGRRFGAVELYVVTYSAILIVWPGLDPRFWLPILPLLLLIGAYGLQSLARAQLARVAFYTYLAAYCLLGMVALAYSLHISTDRTNFPYRYGDGSFTQTYNFVYHGEGSESDSQARALRILRRFEPAIHPAARSPSPKIEHGGADR
jgi:hypothetical protein